MQRPYIICHMTQSIDGKVTGAFLGAPECAGAVDAYYEINRAYKADAFACGRVTMEGSFTGGFYPDLSEFTGESVPAGDYTAKADARFFAVSFDRRGRLGWRAGVIDELSLVVAPVVAEEGDKPLFTASTLAGFTLIGAKKHACGAVWLNYVRG